MPQVTVDIQAIRDGDLTHITVSRGNETMTTTLHADKLPTIEAAVAWIVWQRLRTVMATEIQRRVTFTYHVETDPESGEFPVVDSIDDVRALPQDQGKTDFENLPGWATWTAQEASNWIETNVVDLPTAKTTMQAMAKAIVYLRDIVIG